MENTQLSFRTKTRARTRMSSDDLLSAILHELQKLRSDIVAWIPTERLEDYAHPDRIRRSYQKALKRYPPRGV